MQPDGDWSPCEKVCFVCRKVVVRLCEEKFICGIKRGVGNGVDSKVVSVKR